MPTVSSSSARTASGVANLRHHLGGLHQGHTHQALQQSAASIGGRQTPTGRPPHREFGDPLAGQGEPLEVPHAAASLAFLRRGGGSGRSADFCTMESGAMNGDQPHHTRHDSGDSMETAANNAAVPTYTDPSDAHWAGGAAPAITMADLERPPTRRPVVAGASLRSIRTVDNLQVPE